MSDRTWTELDERTYRDGKASSNMLGYCLLYFLILAGVSLAVWAWL